jgi:hypothetical protein
MLPSMPGIAIAASQPLGTFRSSSATVILELVPSIPRGSCLGRREFDKLGEHVGEACGSTPCSLQVSMSEAGPIRAMGFQGGSTGAMMTPLF